MTARSTSTRTRCRWGSRRTSWMTSGDGGGKSPTAAAAAKLVELSGGVVVGLGFVIELEELAGRGKLDGYDAIVCAM